MKLGGRARVGGKGGRERSKGKSKEEGGEAGRGKKGGGRVGNTMTITKQVSKIVILTRTVT